MIRKIGSIDSRSDVYTSEPIPSAAVSDPSSRRFATDPYGRHTGVIDSVRTRNKVILRVSSPDPAARTSTKPLRQPKI